MAQLLSAFLPVTTVRKDKQSQRWECVQIDWAVGCQTHETRSHFPEMATLLVSHRHEISKASQFFKVLFGGLETWLRD